MKSKVNNAKVESADNVPKSKDWSTTGAVTPVVEQGDCGSCWAFAANGALSGLYYIKNKTTREFSVQQLMDCTRDYDNYSCDGG